MEKLFTLGKCTGADAGLRGVKVGELHGQLKTVGIQKFTKTCQFSVLYSIFWSFQCVTVSVYTKKKHGIKVHILWKCAFDGNIDGNISSIKMGGFSPFYTRG